MLLWLENMLENLSEFTTTNLFARRRLARVKALFVFYLIPILHQ